MPRKHSGEKVRYAIRSVRLHTSKGPGLHKFVSSAWFFHIPHQWAHWIGTQPQAGTGDNCQGLHPFPPSCLLITYFTVIPCSNKIKHHGSVFWPSFSFFYPLIPGIYFFFLVSGPWLFSSAGQDPWTHISADTSCRKCLIHSRPNKKESNSHLSHLAGALVSPAQKEGPEK